MELVRKKSTDEDIEPVITSIEQQASSLGVEDPMLPSTDAFVTSICFVGSKSLSHLLSCIERSKDRLLAIGPKSPAARRQIITSVMEYWTDQPGIGISIVDKLLNYTILTPHSVIEWTLVDALAGGTVLTRPHAFEMVWTTIGKVTNRIRQIVAARTQPSLVEPQLGVIHDTLTRERADVQAMFTLIKDSLLGVASGSNDQMIEREDDAALVNEDDLVKDWGKRWLRVFRRKEAVEEAFVADAMASAVPLGTTAPPPPAEPENNGATDPADTADVAIDGGSGAGIPAQQTAPPEEDDALADIY